MNIELNDYNLKELREWLRCLNQPISGNKAALVARLNEIPTMERGVCPHSNNDEYYDAELENVDDAGGEGACATSICSNVVESPEAGAVSLDNELELLRKQLEALAEENKRLKGEKAKSQLGKRVNSESNNPSIAILKDLIAEYDGTGDVKIWAEQFENLSKVYDFDADTGRLLFISKMRGKAQQWLHSMPDFIIKDVSALVSALIELFGVKVNILKLRKNFESRKWRMGESFAQYCNEKCALAVEIKMQEEELVEYLIDGIPVANLRVQANVLCLNSKAQLLQAFSKIE